MSLRNFKKHLKDIKEVLNKGRIVSDSVKMSVLPKLISKFNAIPIKFQWDLFLSVHSCPYRNPLNLFGHLHGKIKFHKNSIVNLGGKKRPYHILNTYYKVIIIEVVQEHS